MSRRTSRNIGDRFGRLVVTNTFMKNGIRFLELKCDCGNIVLKKNREISKHKIHASCGCAKSDANRLRLTKHGLYGTRIYGIWFKMIQRCENPDSLFFDRYGGRGISVCKEWHDVSVFNKWALNNGYSSNLTIDRINNDGNYEPSNCRWTTPSVQANNRSSNVKVDIGGIVKNICGWADEFHIKRATVCQRIARGWNTTEALAVPVNNYNDNTREE